MSDKRKFLIENFGTIQKARARKPRPLSYEKIAKILSANGVKVSSQLVKAVCKEEDEGKLKKELAALDRAATNHNGASNGSGSTATKPPSRNKRPK